MEQKQEAERAGRAMTAETLREYRKTKMESQISFWARFGVTQSRGSRFEMGKKIPQPVAILLKLYFDGVISDGDLLHARHGRSRRRRVKTSSLLSPSLG